MENFYVFFYFRWIWRDFFPPVKTRTCSRTSSENREIIHVSSIPYDIVLLFLFPIYLMSHIETSAARIRVKRAFTKESRVSTSKLTHLLQKPFRSWSKRKATKTEQKLSSTPWKKAQFRPTARSCCVNIFNVRRITSKIFSYLLDVFFPIFHQSLLSVFSVIVFRC